MRVRATASRRMLVVVRPALVTAPLFLAPLFLGLGALASVAPAGAQTIEQTYDFVLDEWISIEAEEVPITIHRLRVARREGGVAARLARNPRYDQQLELQLEYSNDSTRDWEADVTVEWQDAEGNTIEGIETDFDLDERQQRAIRTERSSANRYGVEHATKLAVRITLDPD